MDPLKQVGHWQLFSLLLLLMASPPSKAEAQDENWDDRFGYPGINGVVFAVQVSGGNLYVGGDFRNAAGVNANYIAMWDGRKWSAVGGGVNGIVNAIAADGNDLYVGGSFTLAGSVAANRIAKWDGTNWWPLGDGLGLSVGASPSAVFALSARDRDLFVGGFFTSAGGVSTTNIARWNGTEWSALGKGVGNHNTRVTAMVSSRTNTYAAGYFTGAPTGDQIVRWDGTNWSELGAGPFRIVYALAISDQGLLAGGAFSSCVARWEGNKWSPLGDGVSQPVSCLWDDPGVVTTIVADGRGAYVGGQFTLASGVAATNVARWDGTNWMALGSGVGNWRCTHAPSVRALARGDCLFAGGLFDAAGDVPANNIAKWNGTVWSALGSGVNGEVFALATNGHDLYVGGQFTSAGGLRATNIAKWDGTNWFALGSGVDGPVYSIESVTGRVYVAGAFGRAGNKPSLNFAIWHIPQSLEIQLAGRVVFLRWPAAATDYLLEATHSLVQQDWASLIPTPLVIDDRFTATNVVSSNSRFYRLRRP